MFRYAQDWDLWLRMSRYGGYAEVEDLLYTHRIFPCGTSMRRRNIQQEFARLALAIAAAKRTNSDVDTLIAEVNALLERVVDDERSQAMTDDRVDTAGLYFLGSCFEKHNGRRARSYFRRVLKVQPTNVRALARYLMTWVPIV